MFYWDINKILLCALFDNKFVSSFLPSPQTVSDGAVCLRKFHWLLHNMLIINIDKFLQRGRILIAFI